MTIRQLINSVLELELPLDTQVLIGVKEENGMWDIKAISTVDYEDGSIGIIGTEDASVVK